MIRIIEKFIEKVQNGVLILDMVTGKCKVEKLGKYTFQNYFNSRIKQTNP